MNAKNDTTKPETELKQEAGEGCSGATCSLSDDLKAPLPRVQRGWIRRPVTLALMPLVGALCGIAGALEGMAEFFSACWDGEANGQAVPARHELGTSA